MGQVAIYIFNCRLQVLRAVGGSVKQEAKTQATIWPRWDVHFGNKYFDISKYCTASVLLYPMPILILCPKWRSPWMGKGLCSLHGPRPRKSYTPACLHHLAGWTHSNQATNLRSKEKKVLSSLLSNLRKRTNIQHCPI